VDEQLLPLEQDGQAEQVEDALRDLDRRILAGRLLQQYRELIPTQPAGVSTARRDACRRSATAVSR
jgi:hypothetical protein